jgi:hypothetical protein
MAFELKDADVAAVYFRSGRAEHGTERLRLAPYMLVTYPDGATGIQPYPVVSHVNSVVYTARDFEVNRIEVYDGDPYAGLTTFNIF